MSFNEKRSYTEYNVTTSTSVFAIGFDDYNVASKDRIIVTVDGVEATAAGYTVTRSSPSTLTLNPAVASGVVRLTRETNIDQTFNKFTAGSLFTPKNVNANFEQILRSQQEVEDRQTKLEGDVLPLVDGLEDALAAAEAASQAAIDAAESAEFFGSNYGKGIRPLWVSTLAPYTQWAEVRLDNGDIVKSLIPDNNSNPNLDMSTWELVNNNRDVVSTVEDYYETGLEFGKGSKGAIKLTRNGVLAVDVERDGVLLAKNVTVPYSVTMPYRSNNNIPFKRLFVPSAGFEESNQSGSLVFGYKDNKPKLALLNVNDLIPFDPDFKETENQTSILTVTDYPYQVVALPANNDYLPKYLKLAEIPANSDYALFSCEFFGGWNNERYSTRTILNFCNYGNINWSNAGSYTAADWQNFIKVISEGSQGNRLSLKALNFVVKYQDNKLMIYAVLPPYSYYTALVTCLKNANSSISLDGMSFTDVSSPISIYRGISLNTYNSGIASDGTVVMCDAHIRIARSSNPSDTTRELTSNGYHWIGSGTTNMPTYSNVNVEKIGTGTYRLNNVSGLWNAEVRLRQPYDLDGNQAAIASISGTTPTIYINQIKYTVQAGGTNVIKEKGDLIDIPSNAWVDVFYSENWS